MHGPDGNFFGDSGYGRTKDGNLPDVFRCVHTSLYEGLSVRPSVRLSVNIISKRLMDRERGREQGTDQIGKQI